MGEVMEEITITLKGRGAAKVAAFALGMQEKLNENGHKPGWKEEPVHYLLGRLNEERKELNAEVGEAVRVRDVVLEDEDLRKLERHVREEAFDVGNFAMMIADVAGGLE